MEYDRLRNLAPNVEAVELDNWIIASFTTAPFRLWLSEWKKHLFCAPAESYCHRIDYSSAGTANEVSHHPLQLLLPFLDAQNTNFNSFSFQEFPDDPFAPAIWRSYTPQKCKFFLWLLHKNRLRTKARLLHCHMHNNGECPFCTAEEDCFHLFINCLVVKAFGYSSALTLLPSLKHLVLISFGRLIPSRKMIAELPAQFSFVSFGIFGSAEMQKFSGTMMKVISYFREDAMKILSYGHTDALLLLEK